MRKILIMVTNDALFFSYYTRIENKQDLDLTNTNIIQNDELIFSVEYIITNQKIIISFLNDLVRENKITNIDIENYDLCKLIMPIINNLNEIVSLRVIEDQTLPYSLCEAILENKVIKKLDVYSIAPYMLEMLDKKLDLIETRSEILFTSDFMAINNLSQFSKIFYKTSVRIEKAFLENDFNDFMTFCKINKYIKKINFYVYDEVMIKQIGEILHDARIKNVKLLIHKNITSKEEAEKLKELKILFDNKYSILLDVVYTDSYLKENIFGHLVITVLKTISVVVVIIVIAIFGTIMFNNYLSSKKVDGISKELDKIINEVEESKENTTPNLNENNQRPELIVSNKFMALLKENDETVGWLKVKNTEIDYPVVKATDNSFYLTHDYYKTKEYNGWIFMDNRNSVEELNRNTIIYGHNRYQSGLMFGTLANAMKKDWYMNEENQIISFESLYENLEFQIFSIYKVKKTSDYIQTHFIDNEQYLDFLDMVKQRSIHYFGIDLDQNDKILTLSTCMDQNNRLVVHAVLKK